MNQAPQFGVFGGNSSGIGGPVNNYHNVLRPPASFYPNINSDFASLPPAVNMLPSSKDLRIDSQDILDGLEQRR